MHNDLRLFGLGLIAAVGLTGMAHAAPAVNITGGLYFPTNPFFSPTQNFFDPANGYVPGNASNASSATVPIGMASEFVFADSANGDGADFSNTFLTIADFTYNGAYPFVMTFTADRSHFFDNAVLLPNSFGGSISVVGNTLTFLSPNQLNSGTNFRTATITFLGTAAAAPEPGTWALMIAGFGFVGAAMRRQRDLTMRVAYS